MMRKCSGLRLLQMGKARHISSEIILHNRKNRFKQRFYMRGRLKNLFPHIKLHVKSHLVVPASPCVELFACLPDSLCKNCLHKTVNILIFIGNDKTSLLHILSDAGKPLYNRVLFLTGKDSLLLQHHHMGNASLYILFKELFIKGNGCVKTVHQLIRFLCKSSAPKLRHSISSVC